jgi:16S rRNA U1498 N3-methylase RsmE
MHVSCCVSLLSWKVKLLMEAGALPIALGSNRLRTETAAIMMLSACMMLPPTS